MAKSNHANPVANGLGSFSTVLLLSGLMFLSSFLVGILPLSLALSARRVRALNSLGAGLLVGTALAVIIPEGIGTLFAWEAEHTRQSQDATDAGSVSSLALVLGFVGMYLIDIWPSLSRSQIPSTSRSVLPVHESHGTENAHNELPSSIPLQSTSDISEPKSPFPQDPPSSRASILTTGLLIHSLFDGIALGTSASIPTTSFVVFFALLAHKAPAAFGLTAALLRQGMSKRDARGWLLLFSGAAPVGAIGSWFILSFLGGQLGGGDGVEEWWAGAGMVLSGGTFLYVAMHSMLMAGGLQASGHNHSHGLERAQQAQQEPVRVQRLDVLYMVLGMLLPLLTRIGHGHGHAH